MKTIVNMPLERESIEQWMREFSAAVRNRDFGDGRRLFASEVIGFGTARFRANGLDQLEANQWRSVWPRTTGFTFHHDTARIDAHGEFAVVVTSWSSETATGDRAPVRRVGRATVVLKQAGDRWLAVHTHFSIDPESGHDPLFCSRT